MLCRGSTLEVWLSKGETEDCSWIPIKLNVDNMPAKYSKRVYICMHTPTTYLYATKDKDTQALQNYLSYINPLPAF